MVDGTGAEPRTADVLIDGDRIAHVGPVHESVRAEDVIQAGGRFVAPGFIDAHAHGDAFGPARNSLAMGVTTLVLGQDGQTPGGGTFASWAAKVRKARLAINVVGLSGHGTVRNRAGVALNRAPSEAKRQRMSELVRADLEAGAAGLSLGLEYQPGHSATAEELHAVARPVGELGGVVMSHLRTEDDDSIDDALRELFDQGRAAGCRVHVAHLKVVYGKGAARADEVLALMDRARKSGVAVTADIYPYDASYTTIGIVFPDFAKPPHDYRAVVRSRRDELAEFLRKRVTKRGGPGATRFGSGEFAGRTLAEAARARGKPFEDVLIDMGPSGASAAYFVMDDALQSRLLGNAFVMVGSDGGPHTQHPRGHGTFARILNVHVRERGALSLAEAVRKMTSLPATTLGLGDRGVLRAGAAADVVIFALDEVRDRATFEAPQRLAEGFDWVLVNGQPARARGDFEKARAGRLLGPVQRK